MRIALVIGLAFLSTCTSSTEALVVDCSPRHAILSAGWLGCAPDDITVSECSISASGGEDVAWRASCDGRTVWCSQNGEGDADVHCTSALDAGGD